jgi:hypothetical protein
LAALAGLSDYQWNSYASATEEQPEDATAVAPGSKDDLRNEVRERFPRTTLDDPHACPLILYGDKRTANAEWRKIARKAWKDGNWQRAFASLEFVRALDTADELYVNAPSHGLNSSRETWRLHVVGEILKAVVSTDRSATADRHDHLLLAGMEHLWFCLGLLQVGGGDFYLSCWQRSVSRCEISQQFLTKFIRWLPEIDGFESRMGDGLFSQVYDEAGFELTQPRFNWSVQVWRLVFECGWELTYEEFEDDFKQDFVAMLLHKHVVREQNGRFVLNDPPRTRD